MNERVKHMPKFRMELRWTSKGLDNIHKYGERRNYARRRATEHGVTGPDGGEIQIHETDAGPDWLVEGSRNDVENLATLFRWHNHVTVKVVGPFLAPDEFGKLVENFAKLRGTRP
jgi:hypothetical protein